MDSRTRSTIEGLLAVGRQIVNNESFAIKLSEKKPIFEVVLTWGMDGALRSAYAVALVLVNFGLAAGIVASTARISLGLMMGGVLFGYLIRLGLIFLAVLLVKDAGWISLPALGTTIIVTHLGLLLWEMKYVALSLAHPGLKPTRP